MSVGTDTRQLPASTPIVGATCARWGLPRRVVAVDYWGGVVVRVHYDCLDGERVTSIDRWRNWAKGATVAED